MGPPINLVPVSGLSVSFTVRCDVLDDQIWTDLLRFVGIVHSERSVDALRKVTYRLMPYARAG